MKTAIVNVNNVDVYGEFELFEIEGVPTFKMFKKSNKKYSVIFRNNTAKTIVLKLTMLDTWYLFPGRGHRFDQIPLGIDLPVSVEIEIDGVKAVFTI